MNTKAGSSEERRRCRQNEDRAAAARLFQHAQATQERAHTVIEDTVEAICGLLSIDDEARMLLVGDAVVDGLTWDDLEARLARPLGFEIPMPVAAPARMEARR